MGAPDTLERFPFPVLIGDIGGTNARFALVDDAAAAMKRVPTVHTADFATIDDAIASAVFDGAGARPKATVLALAGPIAGDSMKLTNCDWTVKPKRLIERFGLNEVVLLNDFEAQSLALPSLGADDVEKIGGGTMEAEATQVVLGPGTGLGVGALVHGRTQWVPVPGEGGHVDLGPRTKRDIAIWPHIEIGPNSQNRVEAETLISGGGLLRLYRAICATDGTTPTLDSPEAVTHAGLDGREAAATEALDLFATYLGRLAGDVALIFMPFGGVFLGGGIAPRIAAVLQKGGFREAFVDKAPHQALLERMATAIVTHPEAALVGIAAFAQAPLRFGVDLRGRRWTD